MLPDRSDNNDRPVAEPFGRTNRRWLVPMAMLGLLLLGGVFTTSFLVACWLRGTDDGQPQAGTIVSLCSNPLPGDLFQSWPQNPDGKKKVPDVALILSGQQHSYLKFCGCSEPQRGGFERRANFMDKLRELGWPLVAADLGDLVEFTGGIHDQSLLKYETAMKGLELLGYKAIALGRDDYNLPLEKGLSLFTLQGHSSPRVLAANMNVATRMNQYPLAANTSMIELWEMAQPKGGPTVGIIGLTGRSAINGVQDKAKNQFDQNDVALTTALQQTAKADLRLLLFQGTVADARLCAGQPQFKDKLNVILCCSDDDSGPQVPTMVGNVMIVQVGWKGKFIGVVGAYRSNKPGQPFELHYQKVALDPVFETDKGKEKNSPILKILQEYAEQVRDQRDNAGQSFLERWPRSPTPVVANQANVKLTYVGSQACAGCHKADYTIWQKSGHAHALDALIKNAEKPSLRQYDPECVRCHVVGFNHQSGYVDEKKTPLLRDVGCENCHGPGSAHVAQPNNKVLNDMLSPWKDKQPNNRLPPAAKLAQGGLNQAQQQLLLHVNDTCIKCHDLDNDPHFKFETFWPKIEHGKK